MTLIEMLVVLALAGLLIATSASSLRGFWFTQSLNGATDEVVTQLRQLQARVTSESHPLVYGARFSPGSSDWALVRFDPVASGTADDTCTQYAPATFDSGVFTAEVVVSPTGTAVPDSNEASICRSRLKDSAGSSVAVAPSDVFVFFYARGTATAGTIRLEQPNTFKSEAVTITSLTARVERS